MTSAPYWPSAHPWETPPDDLVPIPPGSATPNVPLGQASSVARSIAAGKQTFTIETAPPLPRLRSVGSIPEDEVISAIRTKYAVRRVVWAPIPQLGAWSWPVAVGRDGRTISQVAGPPESVRWDDAPTAAMHGWGTTDTGVRAVVPPHELATVADLADAHREARPVEIVLGHGRYAASSHRYSGETYYLEIRDRLDRYSSWRLRAARIELEGDTIVPVRPGTFGIVRGTSPIALPSHVWPSS